MKICAEFLKLYFCLLFEDKVYKYVYCCVVVLQANSSQIWVYVLICSACIVLLGVLIPIAFVYLRNR